MLRRTFIASAVLLATAAAAPSAFAFTEGKDADYITLEKPLAGGEGKIVKVWSYDCPFCFKFDVGVDPKAIPAAEKATGLKFDMYSSRRRRTPSISPTTARANAGRPAKRPSSRPVLM